MATAAHIPSPPVETPPDLIVLTLSAEEAQAIYELVSVSHVLDSRDFPRHLEDASCAIYRALSDAGFTPICD